MKSNFDRILSSEDVMRRRATLLQRLHIDGPLLILLLAMAAVLFFVGLGATGLTKRYHDKLAAMVPGDRRQLVWLTTAEREELAIAMGAGGVGKGVAAAMWFTGWLWLDPVVSLGIVVVIVLGTWGLLLGWTGQAPERAEPRLALRTADEMAEFTASESFPSSPLIVIVLITLLLGGNPLGGGGADLGVVGLDTLLEHGGQGLSMLGQVARKFATSQMARTLATLLGAPQLVAQQKAAATPTTA